MLLTSEEIQYKLNDLLLKLNITARSIRVGSQKNPIEGVRKNTVFKASKGKLLKLTERKAFQDFFEGKRNLKPALSQKEITKKIRNTIHEKGLVAHRIHKGLEPNPLDGYIGRENLYRSYRGLKINRPTRQCIERFYKDQQTN